MSNGGWCFYSPVKVFLSMTSYLYLLLAAAGLLPLWQNEVYVVYMSQREGENADGKLKMLVLM